MTECKFPIARKGFTLIELLIVILVVSLIYFLGFRSMKLPKREPKALTPLNLKENIVSSKWFKGHASLLCLDKCKTCLLRRGLNGKYQAYSSGIDLSNIKAYTVDASNSLTQIEYERYNDKKICLQMDFYPNGSSTQIILEDDKGSYFLPAYFEKAKAFGSPEDAKDYWLSQSNLVSDAGDFY
jgi:prepilin-type N-terminal cleavage/methylation domain-containing protein